jgi:glycosyltransferase involved in cell wall biosynthesis
MIAKRQDLATSVSVIAHEHNKQAQRVVPAIKFLNSDIQVNFLCGKHTAQWHKDIDKIPNAHIIGFLPDEQYVQTIMESSAVVMLSNFEGFGIPIVEAQRLGVPVVIANDRALLEIGSPDACVVAEDASPQEIAQAIQDAIVKSSGELRPGQYDDRSWMNVTSETVAVFKTILFM